MNDIHTIALMALVLSVAACTTGQPVNDLNRHKPVNDQAEQQRRVTIDRSTTLESQFITVLNGDRQDLVLNLMELGKVAMLAAEFNIAEKAFDKSLDEIETIYGTNEYATQARSLWYSEGRKLFKGEPYERAMAYLYRGILYLIEGDYGNARASFEGGILQDAFAEEQQHRADFALLHALSYWSALKFGQFELAADSSEEFKRIHPEAVLPPQDHNVVVIVETGLSPRKLSDGPGHTALVYRRGKRFKDETTSLRFQYSNSPLKLQSVEDLFFQASTRGGRAVDKVLDGKLVFRQSAEQAGGNLASVADAAAEATRGSTTNQASIGQFVGATKAMSALALGIGAKVKPQADIRYWSSLPDKIHLGSVFIPPDTELITVDFYTSDGDKLPGMSRTANVEFDVNGNGVLWVGRSAQQKEAQ